MKVAKQINQELIGETERLATIPTYSQNKAISHAVFQALAEDRKKIGKWLKLRFNFRGEWQGSLADYEDVIKNLEQGKLPEGIDD